MKKKSKIMIMIIIIVSIVLFLSAGTLAYWYWSNIGDAKNLKVSIAGVRNSDINYAEGESLYLGDFKPMNTFCESSSTTLSFSKKERIKDINLSATIHLDINSIGENISNSDDVYWVITSGEGDITCEEGLNSSSILSHGTFNGVGTGDVLDLYSVPVTTSAQTFTVWIWIDSAGSNLENLSGQSLDVNVWTEIVMVYNVPNKPVLDDGMIPVTIANDGTVTIVSEDDPSWYNYENKQWANIVLVEEDGAGETNSHPRTYYQDSANIGETVTQEDILAYYVWIPRYKYRMHQTKCSGIPENERNMEDYPECYAPYTLTDDEKTALIRYRSDDALCMGWYEDDQINAESTKDIELGLSTGRLSDGQTIQSLVEGYKNYYLEYDGYYDCGGGEEMSISEITLTPSDFNGNITYTTKEGTIDILFEGSDEVMKLGNAKTEYRSHPSFWWDDDNDGIVDNNETIAGIWVGKFETTPDKSSTCYTSPHHINCNNSTQNPTILPETNALSDQIVSNQFYTSRNISKEGNIYGLNNASTNAHMMKSRDWGAVVYLSHSEYGINKEVYRNNKNITGRSDGNERNPHVTACFGETSYTWLGQIVDADGKIGAYATDRTKGTNASTTGNVTGIYDMSGGEWENVMGHYGNTVYIDEEWTDDFDVGLGDHSGFEELPELKYYDLYSEEDFPGTDYGNLVYCTVETCGGHVLNEIVGWYNYYPRFVYKFGPWVKRGNSCSSNASIFSFGQDDGSSHLNTWRSVLVLGFGS